MLQCKKLSCKHMEFKCLRLSVYQFLIILSYSINKEFNLWFIVDLDFFPNFNFIKNIIFIYLKFYFMHNNNKFNYLNYTKFSKNISIIYQCYDHVLILNSTYWSLVCALMIYGIYFYNDICHAHMHDLIHDSWLWTCQSCFLGLMYIFRLLYAIRCFRVMACLGF
jgi:hypothetical protein